MVKRIRATAPELRLLLACVRVRASGEDDAALRQLLDAGVDWTLFARKAVDHGLVVLAGHTLCRVAPGTVPDDILEAFRTNIEQTRKTNRVLFDELARVADALAKQGVEAIPFGGLVIAIQSYGDLGLRAVNELDWLIRDSHFAPAVFALSNLGYEHKAQLTAAQRDLIHRRTGQVIVRRESGGFACALHTRLTGADIALDVDYTALWRRAQRANLLGRTLLTLAPEDGLLALAIRGGAELWRRIKWASDVAAFIGSHPQLDWVATLDRARNQGCQRMLLLATSLARRYFGSTVPDAVAAAECADSMIEPIVGRIVAHWQTDSTQLRNNTVLGMDRLWLHDGLVRRVRHVARRLYLPEPRQAVSMPLPRGLRFAYGPIRVGQDIFAPLVTNGYRRVVAKAERVRNVIATSDLAFAVVPASNEMKRHRDARLEAKQALVSDPANASAWRKLGDALSGLRRYEEAIVCYDKALALAPDQSPTWKKRSAALEAIGKSSDLPDDILNPQDANAWVVRAGCLWVLKRFAEAIEASDLALELDPHNAAATRVGIQSRLFACDWRKRDQDKRQIAEGVRTGQYLIAPFFHRAICDSERESQIMAQQWARKSMGTKPLWRGEIYRHEKIRIAYVSTDLHDHVVANVIAGCFEHHDKERFETTAISLGPNDGSDMRRRLEAAFDRFIDAEAMTDDELATKMRALEIDIAIDLNGNPGASRARVLAHRPVPVQVNYLGYPGTNGTRCYDYIIADPMLIPDENRVFFSEQVVYLPHTYMPADRKLAIAANTPTRAEVGLPETAFVFACHHPAYKIAPEIFDVWMRLLRTVDGSVLWLRSNPDAVINLRREARERGVAPERLLFAPHARRLAEHLARLRLADLFLDTLPYNAHSSGCDALWTGVPVLTSLGNTFAGRVGASLLRAVGLPDLVTGSLAEYEDLARRLAQEPERLSAIRAKLLRNRDTEPLFDTARFTRDLEAAYIMMWERTQRGESPESLSVSSALNSRRDRKGTGHGLG